MIRTRYLTAYVISSDALLLLGALPLQRFALHAALSPHTGAPLIFGLLALNVLLLAVVVTAALASCGVLVRLAAHAARTVRRTRQYPRRETL